MLLEIEVSYPLAFAAGIVSFLSPCILPVVPSYLAFISGFTLEELQQGDARGARSIAALQSVAFMFGFALVFMSMGLVATAVGAPLARVLPWVNRAGGGLLILFGGVLLGWQPLVALSREWRVRLRSRPAGALGSILVGVAFGAGWSPCIGPVLGMILLYASFEATMVQGTLLLATYAAGLGLPFVAVSLALSTYLSASRRLFSVVAPLQRVAGVALVVIGGMMVSGQFARMTAFLAGLGQLINLDIS